MFINEQFLPGVLVRERLGPVRFGLGATMVLRRSLLERLGGFARLADCLADDHMLGRMVDEAGFRVVLSRYVVQNVVHETGIGALLRHELRWARTIRAAEPLGYAFSFVIHGVAVALVGAAALTLAGRPESGAALLGLVICLRLWLHFSVHGRLAGPPARLSAALAPARDVLGLVIWAMSYCGRTIVWRGTAFSVGTDGLMTAAGENGT